MQCQWQISKLLWPGKTALTWRRKALLNKTRYASPVVMDTHPAERKARQLNLPWSNAGIFHSSLPPFSVCTRTLCFDPRPFRFSYWDSLHPFPQTSWQMCIAIRPEHVRVVWSSDVSYPYCKAVLTAATEQARVAVGTCSCIISG